MDKEQVFRAIVIALCIIFLIGAFLTRTVLNYSFLFFIILSAAVFLVLIVFEVYIRIQHNIDGRVKNIGDEIADLKQEVELSAREASGMNQKFIKEFDVRDNDIIKINETVLDSVRQFFVMKNDISFKVAIFKSDTEKNLRDIKDSLEAAKKDINDNLESIKRYQEDLKGQIKKLQTLHAKFVKVFWYRSNNLGDRLSPIILEHFLGKRAELAGINDKEKLLGVGSILDALRENDVVWGSGLISEKKMKAPNGVRFLAVRGPLTRSMIEGDVPEIYGDPAILMPLIYNPEIKKTHKVGILPHYIDKVLWEGKTFASDTKLIDVESHWKKVIDEILSCEVIRTSSLHGIIISEAYGIPVIWEKYSDDIIGGEFKFQDYFLGTGRGKQKYGEQLPQLLDLKNKQNVLINALKKYYEE